VFLRPLYGQSSAHCGYHYSTFDNEIVVESRSKTLSGFVTWRQSVDRPHHQASTARNGNSSGSKGHQQDANQAKGENWGISYHFGIGDLGQLLPAS
jgi:hypothetical protein